ncbi:hydrolase, partial [Gemmatimonadota bacterium]
FPEKRPFFLENAGFFSVGVVESELFFSRSIGIAEGQPVPIKGGARLSGRTLGLNVGLLHIETDELEGVQGGNAYSVARIAKEGPSRSRIGGIILNRDGKDISGDHNRTYAVDGQVGIGDAITLSGFLARTETPGMEDRDHALHLNAAWDSRGGRGFVTYREMGPDFNPEMGFIPRRGYRTWDALVLKNFRPESISWLREIRPHAHYTVYDDIDTGLMESEKIHVDVHFELEDGALFSPAMNYVTEGLEEPFEIAEGVVLQPGTYAGWEGAWRINSNLSAPLSVQADLDFGSFLSGTRRGITTTVTARRGASLSTALRVSHQDVNLPEGDFTRTLLGLRLGYFFTPRIYLQSLVQYSDQEEIWSANVRFGWLNTAGTGLFLVYNGVQNTGSFLETGLPRGPMERSFIVKYTRQFTLFGG